MIGRVAHSEDQYLLLLLFDHASCYSIASYSNYALLLVNTASVVFIQMYIHLFGICDWMMAYHSGTRKRVECRQSTLHVIIKCTTWLIGPLLQEYIIFNDMILTRMINGYLHVIEKKEYQVCVDGWYGNQGEWILYCGFWFVGWTQDETEQSFSSRLFVLHTPFGNLAPLGHSVNNCLASALFCLWPTQKQL